MRHPFTSLVDDYTACLVRMQITRPTAINSTVARLLRYIDEGRYKAGCDATGVPQIWAAASFEREASSKFDKNPAQGAPLHQRSAIIPRNGPFDTWTEAQIAAYKIDGLDKVGGDNWSWQLACYYAERFNGFGPRNHGRQSGYVWAGSDVYTGGKYVADGVWDPKTYDIQLGVIPMMRRMVELRPGFALPVPYPTRTDGRSAPSPVAVPVGLHDAATLQADLNALGANPKLLVDGNYGRLTRHAVMEFQSAAGLKDVDGLAGPLTWAAIEAKLGKPARSLQ